ncbi:uncharacterized protein [Spinacia oleracea]|uniref:DUF4371 domain-containing protein n=1 Tax=Spinacia oleracea TaxID=3562 RepID=A0ABM3R3B1_SPIOL|nr:uncharacterized protein LOC130465337 [Spinacia oleracea]
MERMRQARMFGAPYQFMAMSPPYQYPSSQQGVYPSPGTLRNAPQNAQYIALDIQKQIFHIFAQKVQNEIRKEIGDSKFCIIVDESRDVSKREQMDIVIRCVDGYGILRERFLELIHVKDTTSKTLKEEITTFLSNHELSINNLRGQGYDGASNMRREWNAHQLQLALVAAAREVFERHDELQDRQVTELEHLVEIEEVETGKGLNQIGTLKRPGDTRWSSHFKSICSVVKMFNATRSVLEKIATDRQATYALCRALQHKSIDLLNAMDLVASTKSLIQKFRDDGWENILQKVLLSCNKHAIIVPDLQVPYSDFIRSRRNKDVISVEHHYRVDVFTATMDQQMQELNSRFSEQINNIAAYWYNFESYRWL